MRLDETPDVPVHAPGGRGAPPSFHVLAKPTGAICNLDCDYCFFLAKEELSVIPWPRVTHGPQSLWHTGEKVRSGSRLRRSPDER